MKTTQKAIKQFLINPDAIDATRYTCEQYDEARKAEGGFEDICYSVGIYGRNGSVVKGRNSGRFYVVTCRSSAIFLFY